MRVGTDRDADAACPRLAYQPGVGVEIFFLAIVGCVAVQEPRVDLDGEAAAVGNVEHAILILVELLLSGPSAERGRGVEVPDDVGRKSLEVVDELRNVQFPELLRAHDLVERRELLVVEGPQPIRTLLRMLDRDEVHRPDDAVGPHRVDNVLCVRPRTRIVVHLRPDREAHTAPQPLRNEAGVSDVNAGRLGGAEQIAGLGQLQSAAHRVDGSRILEGQIVRVIGDHQETRRSPAACMIEPEEQHPRGVCDGTLLGIGAMLTLGMTVNVRNGRYPRIDHLGVAKVGV